MDISNREKRKTYLCERGITPIRVTISEIISHANLYFIDGPVGVLIDAGFSGPGCFESVCEGLRGIGKDVSDVGLILLTHGHRDHSGLAQKIRACSGARVHLNSKDGHILVPGYFPAYLDRVFRFYRDMGVSPERVEEMRALSGPDRANEAGSRHADNRVIDGSLSEGDRFESGAGTLTVVETPGHTMGSVSFFLQDGGILFSGDLLSVVYDPLGLVMVEKDGDGWSNFYDEHLASLGRLHRLSPALLLPGHGAPIPHPKRLVERVLGAQTRIASDIEEVLALWGESTVGELTSRIYPRASGPALTNALNSVRGVVLRLGRQGKVEVIDGGRVARTGS